MSDPNIAWKYAQLHAAGHEEMYLPECKLCHQLMEHEPDDTPTAFCATCIYTVADAFASFIINANTPDKLIEIQGHCAHDDCAPDGHLCLECGMEFIYCHPCSEAGGGCGSVRHAAPVCPPSKVKQ